MPPVIREPQGIIIMENAAEEVAAQDNNENQVQQEVSILEDNMVNE